jgi:large subunit ribosomal protein L4
LPWKADMVHQVISSMSSNARQTVADTKDRGEVSGGGKKPWKQKGTGRARHGSSRSPIWIGGGVTHGPLSEKNFAKKINKKMKTQAFLTILSAKAKDQEIVLLDKIDFKELKAKNAQDILNSLSKIKGLEKINYKIGKRALIALPKFDEKIQKSFSNIKSAMVVDISNLSPMDTLIYKYVVLVEPTVCLEKIAQRIK